MILNGLWCILFGGSALLCLAGSGSSKMREEKTQGRVTGSRWIQWGIQGTVLLGVKAKVRSQGRVGVNFMRYIDQSLVNRSRTGVWEFEGRSETKFLGGWAFYIHPLVPACDGLCRPPGREWARQRKERWFLAVCLFVKGLLFPLSRKFSLFGRKSLTGWL